MEFGRNLKLMELETLLTEYGDYAKRQGLRPEYHMTHIMLIMKELSNTSLWLSKSKDPYTDRIVEGIQNFCKFYAMLDEKTFDYTDDSFPFSVREGEYPLVYLSSLADVILHILLYIGGNNWEKEFLEILTNKYLNDKVTKMSEIGRFQNNRIGWRSSED